MSQLWNLNKINNTIRLENANNEGYWNTKKRWNGLVQKKKYGEEKAKKDLRDREKTSWDR
jgi:hypothetical protein